MVVVLWWLDLMLSSVEEVSSRALESYDPLSVGLMFKTKPPATPTAQQKKDGPPFFRTNLVRRHHDHHHT